MSDAEVKIITEGLSQMIRDFERLASPEPFERAYEALNGVLREGFAGTQALVPTDDGDYRRPAGALRDSGRFESKHAGEVWQGEVAYGTDDDRLPYARWARWKNVDKGEPDYLGDPMEALYEHWLNAVNAPFDDVWHRT